MILLGLTGKAGSGKSTVAEYLEKRYGFKRLSFAEPLKKMLLETGLCSYEELYVQKTPHSRRMMQIIGTDIIRNRVDRNYWVMKMSETVCRELAKGYNRLVIDDVRYQNEADFVRDIGGIVVRIVRSYSDGITDYSHESERDDIVADKTIVNDSDLDALYRAVDNIIRR